MQKIGLISDTHGYIHPKIKNFLLECDEIWHAGDIGDIPLLKEFSNSQTIRAVYGNIDNTETRMLFPKVQIFTCEKVKVVMTHIGGYPNRYQKDIINTIISEKPKIFISGHSHILKIIYDEKYNCLHLNPGAAGRNGIHTSITALRFHIIDHDIKNMEILDIKRSFKNDV